METKDYKVICTQLSKSNNIHCLFNYLIGLNENTGNLRLEYNKDKDLYYIEVSKVQPDILEHLRLYAKGFMDGMSAQLFYKE